MKTYRSNGAIGALLDEYEKSIEALKEIITSISKDELIKIVDNETKDKDCRSIQTILSHVVESGYTYVIEIRKWLGENIEYKNQSLRPVATSTCRSSPGLYRYPVQSKIRIFVNEKLYYIFKDSGSDSSLRIIFY